MLSMTDAEQVEFISEAKKAGLAAQQAVRDKIRHGGDTMELFNQLGRLSRDIRVLETELKRL